MPEGLNLSQSVQIPAGLLAQLGMVNEAAAQVKANLRSVSNEIKALDRESKTTGGSQLGELNAKLSPLIMKQQQLLTQQENINQLKSGMKQERHESENNWAQKIRDWTGHATARGYVDYAQGLMMGNVRSQDIGRLGNFMTNLAAKSAAKGNIGTSIALSKAGMQLSGAALRFAGPSALAGVVVMKGLDMYREDNERLAAAGRQRAANELRFSAMVGAGQGGWGITPLVLEMQRNRRKASEGTLHAGWAKPSSAWGRLAELWGWTGERQLKMQEIREQKDMLAVSNAHYGSRLDIRKIRALAKRQVAIEQQNLFGGMVNEIIGSDALAIPSLYDLTLDIFTLGGHTRDAIDRKQKELEKKFSEAEKLYRETEMAKYLKHPVRRSTLLQNQLHLDAVAKQLFAESLQWNPN